MPEYAPGDRVICVSAAPTPRTRTDQLKFLALIREGEVYTVAEAYDYREAVGDWALILAEIDTPFPNSWSGERFAPAPLERKVD